MDAEAQATVARAEASAAGDQAAIAGGKAITRALLGRVSRKATTKDIKAGLVAGHRVELGKFFTRQHTATRAAAGRKAAGVFDPSAWDSDLASILGAMSAATAKAIGTQVAADLGGDYDGAEIAAWLESHSQSSAKAINATTADEITKALENAAEGEDPADTVDGVFDGEVSARSDQIAVTSVAVVGSLAALVAARQSSAKTKTWVVTSTNARASHAGMAGETVPLGELFSNGMDGPGDPAGGADEVAGCTCDLMFGNDSTEG